MAVQPSRKARVHVVGSANEDLTLRVAHLPRPGETVLARSSTVTAGGKGANQAVAAARAGADVAVVARVGDDGSGTRLRTALRLAGVDVRCTDTDPVQPTGRATVTVSDDGENAIVVDPGANAALTPAAVSAALAGLVGGDVVVTQAEIPAETVVTAAGCAARAGALLVVNLAPYRSLPSSTVPADGIVVVNVAEAAALAADLGRPSASPGELADRLGCRVVVTRGAGGAELAVPGDPVLAVPALDAGAVVDTTGAGDAFVGVLAAGLAEGRTLPAAARRACAAAGLSVGAPGAQVSFPDLDRIEQAGRAGSSALAGPAS
jgi:ribokinase